MAGGTPEHGALAAALTTLLGNAVRGRPCRLFNSNVRVHIRETDLTTYPDSSAVCGRLEVDDQDGQAIINPILLVEVLSDSTEAYDRGEKWAHYRRIASLRECVSESSEGPLARCAHRQPAEHQYTRRTTAMPPAVTTTSSCFVGCPGASIRTR